MQSKRQRRSWPHYKPESKEAKMAGEKIRLVISTHDIWEPLQFDPCSAIQESISAAKQIILRKGYVLIGQGSKTAGFETQLTVSSLEGLAKWEERINEIVLKKGRLP